MLLGGWGGGRGGAETHGLVEGGSRGWGVDGEADAVGLGAEGLHGKLGGALGWLKGSLDTHTPHILPEVVVSFGGVPTRMVYLYYISCLRYTILVGNPRFIMKLYVLLRLHVTA